MDERKKIVLSANTSFNIYNFRYGLIKKLVNENYNVLIVAPYDKYTEKLEKLGCKAIDIYINSKSTNPINDLKTFFQYLRIYKKEKPDIVLNFTIKPVIYSSLASSVLGIKTINTITGLGAGFLKINLTTKIIKFLYKISQRNVSKIFFQNKDDLELFIKEKLVNKEKADIISGSGIDTEEFKPIKVEKEDDIFRFLLVARMLWDKGIGEYVEAAKLIKRKYKNVEFLLLGPVGVDNPSAIPERKIKEWEEEGIVKYLGTTDDVGIEIAKVDCIVLPSYREGIPRSLLEAASMGKPIITTDSVGCREVVKDGWNGFLCKVKSAEDLADKMEKMINLTEEERVRMGKRGREKVVREFNEEIVIKKYLKTINNVLQERREGLENYKN